MDRAAFATEKVVIHLVERSFHFVILALGARAKVHLLFVLECSDSVLLAGARRRHRKHSELTADDCIPLMSATACTRSHNGIWNARRSIGRWSLVFVSIICFVSTIEKPINQTIAKIWSRTKLRIWC